MMKYNANDTLKTFATFRVAGDRLAPDEITEIISFQPTLAYAKGQQYSRGPDRATLTGKTGVWFFATDKVIASNEFDDHLSFIVNLLITPRNKFVPLVKLRDLIKRKQFEAHVSCFWFGRSGAKKPSLPNSLKDFFGLIPADIEIDFDTEEAKSRRVA
ncbi:MAG TPA: DUF4279 domain-containing protein [Stellaceae bacterium]